MTGRSRAFLELLSVSVLLVSSRAHAQECKRPPCETGSVDANGCCPAPVSHYVPPPPRCTGGKETSPDTAGHCCWPGQVWASNRCVGAPSACPAGMNVNAATQSCDLPTCGVGQSRANDGIHCCWADQGWSVTRATCVGLPRCPGGFEVEGGDHCVPVDKDGDGIPNAVDKCPDQPEDFNHYKDEDGCPDEAERLAMVQAAAARTATERAAAAAAAANARQLAEAKAAQEKAAADAAAARAAAIRAEKERREAAAAEARRRQLALEDYNAQQSSRRGWKALGIVSVSLGGAAVLLGGFLGVAYAADVSNSEANGGSGGSFGGIESVAIGTAVGGGVAMIAGITLIATHRSLPPFDPNTASVQLMPMPGGVGGRF